MDKFILTEMRVLRINLKQTHFEYLRLRTSVRQELKERYLSKKA